MADVQKDVPPIPPPQRVSHPFFMRDMILSIPNSFKRVVEQMGSLDIAQPKGGVYFTGSGTSFYAVWMGSQLLGGWPGYCLAESNELVWNHKIEGGSMTVGVSHSGVTKSTVDALKKAKLGGSFAVAVTHFAGSPISSVADSTLVVGDGPDLSRCHTKTYIDSAAAVFAISLGLSGGNQTNEELEPAFNTLHKDMVEVISSCEREALRAATELGEVKKLFFVASGHNVVTAREAALKIKESSYIPAEGMMLEEFLHGPWVVLDDESLLVSISPSGPSAERHCDALRAAKRVGAKTMAVSNGELGADYNFLIPALPEVLSPFLTILPLYLFAYHFSVRRGNNPDYLRYLEPKYWEARNIIFPPGTH